MMQELRNVNHLHMDRQRGNSKLEKKAQIFISEFLLRSFLQFLEQEKGGKTELKSVRKHAAGFVINLAIPFNECHLTNIYK